MPSVILTLFALVALAFGVRIAAGITRTVVLILLLSVLLLVLIAHL